MPPARRRRVETPAEPSTAPPQTTGANDGRTLAPLFIDSPEPVFADMIAKIRICRVVKDPDTRTKVRKAMPISKLNIEIDPFTFGKEELADVLGRGVWYVDSLSRENGQILKGGYEFQTEGELKRMPWESEEDFDDDDEEDDARGVEGDPRSAAGAVFGAPTGGGGNGDYLTLIREMAAREANSSKEHLKLAVDMAATISAAQNKSAPAPSGAAAHPELMFSPHANPVIQQLMKQNDVLTAQMTALTAERNQMVAEERARSEKALQTERMLYMRDLDERRDRSNSERARLETELSALRERYDRDVSAERRERDTIVSAERRERDEKITTLRAESDRRVHDLQKEVLELKKEIAETTEPESRPTMPGEGASTAQIVGMVGTQFMEFLNKQAAPSPEAIQKAVADQMEQAGRAQRAQLEELQRELTRTRAALVQQHAASAPTPQLVAPSAPAPVPVVAAPAPAPAPVPVSAPAPAPAHPPVTVRGPALSPPAKAPAVARPLTPSQRVTVGRPVLGAARVSDPEFDLLARSNSNPDPKPDDEGDDEGDDDDDEDDDGEPVAAAPSPLAAAG